MRAHAQAHVCAFLCCVRLRLCVLTFIFLYLNVCFGVRVLCVVRMDVRTRAHSANGRARVRWLKEFVVEHAKCFFYHKSARVQAHVHALLC